MSHDWPYLGEGYLDLLNLSELINSSPSVRAVKDDILKFAIRVFKAESGQFCIHASKACNPDKDYTALVNLSWKYTDQYIHYYHDIDPYIRTMPEAGAWRDVDIMPKSAWQKHEFNYDFIMPQKIRHLLVIHLRNMDEIVGHIGLHRYDTNFPFTKKDLFKARFLSNLFNHNLVQKQLIQKLNSLETILKQIMIAPSTGIIVLDSYCHPVYWNSRTMEFSFSPVNRQNADLRSNGYCPLLPREVIEECAKIRDSLVDRRILQVENRHINLWPDDGRKLEAEILVLPNEQRHKVNQDPYYFMIILNKVESVHSRMNTVASCIEKLTPKEAEIAKYICQGLTNKEISNKLFISLPTVATHVQHIFQKLEIKSRSKLVRRLLL